jgi:serine/threonine protein kinase/Flp pilus assembly protein TadD
MSEREMFEAALELAPENRAAYLDGVCAADAALRQRLEALLQRHAQAGSFLEAPAVATLTTLDPPISERPATVIGPYKLLEQIGEGGFGVVFMAEQQQPIRRKVALKILKPGMDTRQVVARFEAERQALALMDHPNIAKVLDAGQTSSGRPYVVMDLVKGMPITEFCDQGQLPPGERLELFGHVCQAVQHAHQKGIIHRDIKPTNVLVTTQDGVPLVKVIDFGIAKALGQHLTDKTLFTNFAQMIGTPLYMSPEQAALSNVDVDTRSDIYSLGVLLYELLTGTTPFDKERFKEAGYDEIRRIIRDEEPPRPSTRLSTLGQAATAISSQRRSEPRRLSQLIRGELDWIVMKCLEKDRNRRYESATSLAHDIERYLHDEPVHACPPSALYRLRKFSQRNKWVLITVALLTVAMAVGTVISAWQAFQATWAREQLAGALKNAEANEAAADNQRRLAEENVKLAIKVLDEIIMQQATRRVELYSKGKARRLTPDPVRDKQESDFLEKGLGFYEQLAQTNRTDRTARREKARAYRQIGWLHHVLGKEAQSVQAFRQAIRLWQELAEESPGDFDSQYGVADAYHLLFAPLADQGHVQEADEANRQARDAFARLTEHFPTEPLCLEGVADCQLHWAWRLMDNQKLLEGQKAIRRSLSVWQKLAAAYPEANNGRYRWQVADGYGWLGEVLRRRGEFAKAIDARKENLAILEKLVAEYYNENSRWDLASSYEQLARVQLQAERPQEAERAYYQAESVLEKLVADFNQVDHRRHLADTRDQRGDLLRRAGRLAEAEEARRSALPVWQKLVGDFNHLDHRWHLATTHAQLAEALFLQGKRAEAEKAYRECLSVWDKLLADSNTSGNRHDLAHHLSMLGTLLADTGRPAEAVEAYRRALPLRQALAAEFSERPAYWIELAHHHKRLGDMLSQANRSDEARDQWSKAALVFAKTPEPDERNPQAWQDRGSVHILLGQWDKAVLDYSRAIELNPDDSWFWHERGFAHLMLRQFDKAVADHSQGLALNPNASGLWARRGQAYLELGQRDKAVVDLVKAVELNPADAHTWYWLALVRVQAGEIKGYRSTCAAMLGRIGETDKPDVGHWAAWATVLAPNAITDLDRAVKMGEMAVRSGDRRDTYLNTLGAVLYRAGRFAEAIRRLNEANAAWEQAATKPTMYCPAYTWFFLAMAHQNLGHAQDAGKWLGKASTWMEQETQQPKSPWNRRVTLLLLRREAETLLKQPAQAPPAPK